MGLKRRLLEVCSRVAAGCRRVDVYDADRAWDARGVGGKLSLSVNGRKNLTSSAPGMGGPRQSWDGRLSVSPNILDHLAKLGE